MPGLVLPGTFALSDSFIFAHLVGHCTTASADGTSDERTFRPTHKRADHGSACGRPSNNLRSCVMTVIMRRLGCFGTLVSCLRYGAEREGKRKGQYCKGCDPSNIHTPILVTVGIGCVSPPQS